MASQERLKQLELLGGLGGAVLGAGIALLFAEWLLPYALPAVFIGVSMTDRLRVLEAKGRWKTFTACRQR